MIIETLTRHGADDHGATVSAEIVDGDKRILLIGGEVVPFALARIPMIGETRQHGRGRPPKRARSPTATARSPRRWPNGCGRRACFWLAST